ncbi:MAG: hypothetical protein HS124_00995 [Anaerolineales bacterium]|nr:hypothetical protein [Anaerolineales bacterium]
MVSDEEGERIVGDFLKRKEGIIRLPDVYVGGWRNDKDGQFYLDASQNFQDFNDAMTSAVYTRQKAIYYLDKGEQIWVGEWLTANPEWVAPEGGREWYLNNPE